MYLLAIDTAINCNKQDVMVVLKNEAKRYKRRPTNLHSTDMNTIHRLRLPTKSSHQHHQHHQLQALALLATIRKIYNIQFPTSLKHQNINEDNHVFINPHRSCCWQPLLLLLISCTHHFPSTWYRRNCQSSRLQQHAPLDPHTRRRTHNHHCHWTRLTRPSTTGGGQLSKTESPWRPQRRCRWFHEPWPDRKLRRIVRLRAKRCLRCQLDNRQLRH